MTRRTIIIAVVLMGAAAGLHAKGAYFSTKSVLKDFFRESERISYVRVTTREHAAAIKAQLGYVPKRPTYVIFVARSGDNTDGYAIVDDQPGQHMPITIATKLSPDGVVQRVEVMIYREGQGDEIREPQFREQFVGKGLADPIRLNADIDAISGATISSKSMAIAVKRAVVLTQIARDSALPR